MSCAEPLFALLLDLLDRVVVVVLVTDVVGVMPGDAIVPGMGCTRCFGAIVRQAEIYVCAIGNRIQIIAFV